AEAFERLVAGLCDVFRPPVDGAGAVRQSDVAELGGDDDAVADTGERITDQALVPARGIGIGSVDHVDPGVDCGTYRRHGLVRVRRAVDRRHAHASEAEHRDLESGGTKVAPFHEVTSLW